MCIYIWRLQLFGCRLDKLVLAFVLLLIPNLLVADKSWQRSSVELVQSKLNDLGYSVGPVDGAWGRKTSSALTLYCEEYEHDCLGGEETVIDLLTKDTDDSYLDVEMDFASAVWFENRIGYGAPKDRVDRYVGMTRREAVDLVVQELRNYQDPYKLPSWFYDMKPLGNIIEINSGAYCPTGNLKQSLQAAWLKTLYESPVPQFDRLATFWLDHFSVGYDAYIHPHAFAKHTEFVRTWRDGSFIDLLYRSLSDPSTIVYLNNDKSDRNTPNENLAREFFELFALGEGAYSENDVRQFARLLTGRSFNVSEEKYEFMSERALRPTVKVLGGSHSEVKTVINDLVKNPAYGEYIITKLYNEFVSLERPSNINIRRLKSQFLRSNSDLLALYNGIISSKTFWELDKTQTLIKSPLDLFAGTSRTLNSTGNFANDHLYWSTLNSILEDYDQAIFDPPSIDGWPTGREWLQGQDIDRRALELRNLFINPPVKNLLLPVISTSTASKRWSDLLYKETISRELGAFFNSARKDQLLFEDMVVEAGRFEPSEYYVLHSTFKTIKYNNRFFDQITLYLNHCVHCDPPWDKHVKLFKETTSNNFMKGARFESDGASVWFGASIPLRNNSYNFQNSSSEDRKMLELLMRATGVIYSENQTARFSQQKANLGESGKKWLTSFLGRNVFINSEYEENSSIRLFKPPKHPDESYVAGFYQHKLCTANMGLEKVILDSYINYQKLRESSGDKNKISALLSSRDYDSEELKVFAENLTKVWYGNPALKRDERLQYLLPNSIFDDWKTALMSVEYNLR